MRLKMMKMMKIIEKIRYKGCSRKIPKRHAVVLDCANEKCDYKFMYRKKTYDSMVIKPKTCSPFCSKEYTRNRKQDPDYIRPDRRKDQNNQKVYKG